MNSGREMRTSNFALRLQPSLLEEARRIAEEAGVVLNQLINVAVAERLFAIRTESFFASVRTAGTSRKESGFWDDWERAMLRRRGTNSPNPRGSMHRVAAAENERSEPEQEKRARRRNKPQRGTAKVP
jgi:hypothetical protein